MQSGFFALDKRWQLLEYLGELFPKLQRYVDWHTFRKRLNEVHEKTDKYNSGC